jgi:hypothetical protein
MSKCIPVVLIIIGLFGRIGAEIKEPDQFLVFPHFMDGRTENNQGAKIRVSTEIRLTNLSEFPAQLNIHVSSDNPGGDIQFLRGHGTEQNPYLAMRTESDSVIEPFQTITLESSGFRAAKQRVDSGYLVVSAETTEGLGKVELTGTAKIEFRVNGALRNVINIEPFQGTDDATNCFKLPIDYDAKRNTRIVIGPVIWNQSNPNPQLRMALVFEEGGHIIRTFPASDLKSPGNQRISKTVDSLFPELLQLKEFYGSLYVLGKTEDIQMYPVGVLIDGLQSTISVTKVDRAILKWLFQ